MSYSNEFRAGRMIWRFQKCAGVWPKATWPFDQAPDHVRSAICRAIRMEANEVPALVSLLSDTQSTLITTDRIVQISTAGVCSFALPDIAKVQPDRQAGRNPARWLLRRWFQEGRIGSMLKAIISEPRFLLTALWHEGSKNRPMTLIMNSGAHQEILIERGSAYIGILNVLRCCSARNNQVK